MSAENALKLTPLMETVIINRNQYYRLAYSFLGNEADAMDAVQQMTLVIIEKGHTLRTPEAFGSWSKKILINICRGRLKERKSKEIPLELPLDLTKAPEAGLANDERVLIREHIQALPLKYREMVYLRYYLNYEYKEIAEYLQIPEGTVKSRLNRAISELKDSLKGAYNE
jgi:RNA polymerase sigma-70 factor (ECF subfamily)